MNKQQRRALEAYLRYRDAPPSPVEMLWRNRSAYTFMLAVALLGCGVFYWLGGLPWALVLPLVILAAIGRDARHCIAFAQTWPVLREVVDWGKLEQKLASPPSTVQLCVQADR